MDKVFDEEKVEKLLTTIYDFILGTKLTNAEIDYTVNALWMKIMANRVAYQALENIGAMMGIVVPPEKQPNYIR